LIELSYVALPNAQMLPVPVEGDPTNGVEHPEHGEIEGIPSRDVAGAATARAVARESIAEVFLIRHQLRTTGIQRTLDQNQGSGVQTQCDRVVNQEIA